MKSLFSRLLSIVLVLGLLSSVLSGCGAPVIKDTYPLESVNRDGQATSYVYRAEDQSVTEVADNLSAKKTPDQISPPSEERMFLVYGKQWYHLQQDPENLEDTLVEVDSQEYVRRNYDSSFLQTYLTVKLLGDLFDSGFGTGSYRGYGSRDVYKPKQGTYKAPTEKDKKIAPPITVERKGLLTRRGKSGSGSVTGGSDSTDKGKSKGSISRKKGGSGIFDKPRTKITKPKTRFGSGKIGRRGRR